MVAGAAPLYSQRPDAPPRALVVLEEEVHVCERLVVVPEVQGHLGRCRLGVKAVTHLMHKPNSTNLMKSNVKFPVRSQVYRSALVLSARWLSALQHMVCTRRTAPGTAAGCRGAVGIGRQR